MDWKWLFTSFDGRIGRQSWWTGVGIFIVAAIVLNIILWPILGSGSMGMMSDPTKMQDPNFWSGFMRAAAFRRLIMLVIFIYPATALMGKRLNDRDRPEWVKFAIWIPSVLMTLLGLLGLGWTVSDIGNGIMIPQMSGLAKLLSVISLVLGIWLLVELGILRGTQGPNRFGPDPLAGK